MALVKYNNNSISAITAASSLPTGAMTLIKEQTASSSSTINFVDGTSDVVLDSTYPIYVFKFINIHPANDNILFNFQGSTDSGSNYNTSMTTTIFDAYHAESGSPSALRYITSIDQANGTSFQTISVAFSGNDEASSGELYLFNPSSTTFVKHFFSRIESTESSYSKDQYCAGYFNTTSAIDAIQFKMSSGDIDAGTIKLYGIKDS
jgi:hypothetical protein